MVFVSVVVHYIHVHISSYPMDQCAISTSRIFPSSSPNHNQNKYQMPNIMTRGECSISKSKSFPNKHRIILPFPIIIHVSRDGSVALDTDQPLFAAPILDAPEVCASAVVTLEDIIIALTLALC